MVERRTVNPYVAGSSPAGGATFRESRVLGHGFFVSDFYTLGYIVDDLSSFGLHMSGSKWHLTLYFYERKVEKLIGKVSDVNDKLLLKTFFEIVIRVTGATNSIS